MTNININKKKIIEFLYINIGLFLMVISMHLFTVPNNFTLGGVTGISILLGRFFALEIGLLSLVINAIIITLGFFFLGKHFVIKTLYGSFAFSIMLYLLEYRFPLSSTLTDNKLLELIYSVFIPGVGMSIVFTNGGTTGGIEVLARIMTKFLKLKLSITLLIMDFFIASLSGIIFGIETFLFSILGVCLRTFVLDTFMETINLNKIVVITCEDSTHIEAFITNQLKRGATLHLAEGVYTHKQKKVITTILSRKQAGILQEYVNTLKNDTFITISNSSKIIGKGFKTIE